MLVVYQVALGTGGLGTDLAQWDGVPSGTQMVGLGTLLTSFEAVSDTMLSFRLCLCPLNVGS